MATKKKKSKKQSPLTLHTLLGTFSYWGSAARVALISFLALVVFIVQVVDAQYSQANMTVLSAVLNEGQVLVYAIVSFLLLDVGYVTVARKYSLSPLLDKAVLIASEATLAIGYFLPYFAIVSERVMYLTRHVFIAVLLLLSLRMVIGMLYGKAAIK